MAYIFYVKSNSFNFISFFSFLNFLSSFLPFAIVCINTDEHTREYYSIPCHSDTGRATTTVTNSLTKRCRQMAYRTKPCLTLIFLRDSLLWKVSQCPSVRLAPLLEHGLGSPQAQNKELSSITCIPCPGYQLLQGMVPSSALHLDTHICNI